MRGGDRHFIIAPRDRQRPVANGITRQRRKREQEKDIRARLRDKKRDR